MATKKPFIVKHGLEVSGNVTVTGTVTSTSVTANLADTGTPTGTFGSGSQVPVITVGADGRITNIANTTVAGVSSVSFTGANNNLRIATADGTTYDTSIDVSDKATWSALLSTNTSIRSAISTLDTNLSGQIDGIMADVATNQLDISSLQAEDSNLWSAITSTNTAVRSYTDTAIADLVASAPTTLDTLNELAAALGDDPNFATTLTTNLGQKLGASATVTLTGDITGSGTFSANAVSLTTDISATGTPTGTFGSGSMIPVITVGADGRITNIANTTVAGVTSVSFNSANNNLRISTADGTTYDTGIDVSDKATWSALLSTNTAIRSYTDTAIATKLDAADYTAADVLTKIKTVDGSGSGLDADLLDGQSSAYYATASSVASEATARQNGDASTLTSAQSYTDTAISNLVNGAPTALDTLNEIAVALSDDEDALAALTTVVDTKLPSSHDMSLTLNGDVSGSATFTNMGDATLTVSIADDSHNHTISNIDGLQTALDGKVDNSQVLTNVPSGAVFTDTNTTYSAGRGLDLSGTEFQLETDLRDSISYVGYDSNDYIQWSNNAWFRSVVNGVERFRVDTAGIDVSGRIVADSDITAYSDSRLKENVEVIDNAVEKVKQVRGVNFDRIADGSRSTGVIAQELEAVLPEAVHTDEEGMKHVAYGNVVGLLIEAIKEQQSQVEELTARIEELEVK